jgi:DNA-directed RNA polymerase specialized sigma24 family protein
LAIGNDLGHLVDSVPSRKEKPELTREAFELLLGRLDHDRNGAGVKYEEVRRRLVKFLGWWGSDFPEEHTDETINRVARKLLAGEVILDINKYFVGVARLVYAEHVKERVKSRDALAALAQRPTTDESAQHRETRFECYERCLETLPEAKRDLVIKYYQEAGGSKANLRDELAARMGIQLNLLRIRAFRIRNSLKDCVRDCLRCRSEDM